jgi:beta-mannosidase
MREFNITRDQTSRRRVLQSALSSPLAPLLLGQRAEVPARADTAPGDPIPGVVRPSRRSTSLNGPWRLTYGPFHEAGNATAPPSHWPTIAATVPGNVELDLIAAGRLPALETGNRIYETRKLESTQWWYRREFRGARLTAGETALLVFDGIDCIAQVWLNDVLLGDSRNMFVPRTFDVTAVLRQDAENRIVIRIDPAVVIGRRTTGVPGVYAQTGKWESLSIRKAPHMYGWDIMPRLIGAGLWRDVRLDVVRPTRLESVYWSTTKLDRVHRQADLRLAWEFTSADPEWDLSYIEVTLLRQGRTAYHALEPVMSTRGMHTFPVEDAEFWWPQGLGAPALYEAVVGLRDAQKQLIDEHRSRIGIRTIELRRTDISTQQQPGEFCFVVNGEPVFVKGTNWTPMDALHSRDASHLDRVFPMLQELNVNMIRCWGGGVYESDAFFDKCDAAGIMVWQDFAFACAAYPQNPEFQAEVAREAASFITRVRNHSCLALWSGNNECDESQSRLSLDPNVHDRISREVLPAAVRQFDPARPYLPSSPYYSPAVIASGKDLDVMPEVHLWGPRGYFKAPFYVDTKAHFVSEIGYHGCPSKSSLTRMFDPQFVFPWVKKHEWNDQWLTKSVRLHPVVSETQGRNDLMLKQVQALFGSVPAELDDFILASQITQAEAMKFFVEFWRQGKGFRRGIIWWNLRDGWPIISDAVVDYYNKRKLAFHYIQRSQRDVQCICCEPANGLHPFVAVNDTLRPVRGHLQVRRAGENASLLDVDFQVEPNGKSSIGSLRQPPGPEMWELAWHLDDGGQYRTHYLATRSTIALERYRGWMQPLGLLDLFDGR